MEARGKEDQNKMGQFKIQLKMAVQALGTLFGGCTLLIFPVLYFSGEIDLESLILPLVFMLPLTYYSYKGLRTSYREILKFHVENTSSAFYMKNIDLEILVANKFGGRNLDKLDDDQAQEAKLYLRMLKNMEKGYGANPKKLLQQYDTEQLQSEWERREQEREAEKRRKREEREAKREEREAEKRRKREEREAEKRRKREEREAKAKQLKQEILEDLKEKYLHLEDIDKYVKEALKGVYSIGMPAEFLRYFFPGEYPGANKKERVRKDKVSFTVQYESLGENIRGNIKYKKEFSVENDLIVGWEDIN